MSTPKFLTWSKGQSYSSKADKKHASAGVVPIPIEYISIKGLDYERSYKRPSKMKRRPIPLEFEKSDHNNTNSFALHDAAIKSATTLMAVMNDVLKSPHLNAHLLTQNPGGLPPAQGRSRSYTAPPPPLFEAPGVEPVELPGSFPVWPNSHGAARSSVDTAASSEHASVGLSTERPQSSPQLQTSSDAFHGEPRQPALITSRSASNFRAITSMTQHKRHRSTSANEFTGPSEEISPTLDSTTGFATRTVSRGPSFDPPDATRASAAEIPGRESIDSQPFAPRMDKMLQDKPRQRLDSRALLDQISAMRRSHEAHVFSLKEAHDREVESHRSYIQFLESCPADVTAVQNSSQHRLTLETTHSTDTASELLSLDVSASASLQSLDSSLEAQRRTSIESANAEAESLKRKLSLYHKTQSELGDVKRERDRFRETSDKSERRIGQLKDIARKSKDAEKAMKNKVQSLEAALLASNIQRIDVLDGYHEACEQIRGLHAKQLIMIKEREEVAARWTPAKSDGTASSSDCDARLSDTRRVVSAIEYGTLSHQAEELQQLVAERDSRIRELETERKDSVPKLEVCKLQAQLADAEATREQYNTLLHAELRRQSKIISVSLHTGTPRVEDEAAVTVADKLRSKPGSENAEKRCELLEKELKHCVSEIILYKLDIRGYRKDLKELRDANANVTELQTVRLMRPEIPERLDTHKRDDKSSAPQRRPRATSGLGISLQHSRTPSRPTTNRLSTPQQQSRTVGSPSSNIVTPLELDKRLPKPPSATREPSPTPPSSPPTNTLNRAETIRSLSESIISSYANRATPEQVQGHVPPLCRGRSADQPQAVGLRPNSYQAIDAIAVPISKYTPDMLKTPNMSTMKGLVKA